MSFTSWRKRMLLSQERLAEMSGLSLRTVQRLEAGYRVSYASLRSIAAAVNADVDVLEREFYAVNQSAGEFIEIPRWVRVLSDRFWFGGPRLRRRDVLLIETFCVVAAAVTFAISFLVSPAANVAAIRMCAVVPLVCGYLTAVSARVWDRYKLWPGSDNAPSDSPRTLRSTAAEYAFFIVVGLSAIVVAAWFLVATA
jgi:transcriptional regulator with XRE-family HTH domain